MHLINNSKLLYHKRRIGKAQAVSTKKSSGDRASPVSKEKIKTIEEPYGETPGPATETSQNTRRPVDI